MTADLDEPRRLLEAQLGPLETRAAALEAELADVADRRGRIVAALDALNGPRKRSRNGSAARPNIDAELVADFAEGVLAERGPTAADDLGGLVREKAKSRGYSLAGFAPCLKSALGRPSFAEADGRVSLRKTPRPR